MTNESDQLRSNIEATRNELGSDVDALADKVNPAKAVHRQTGRVKSAMSAVKDSIMGVADEARENVSDAVGHGTDMAHEAADAMKDAPRHMREQAKGNPLAVGLIAFGVGWLAASLIPASGIEKRASSQVKEKAEPLVHQAAEAAKGVAEDLKGPAQEAAQAVGDTAKEGAQHVKSEAASGAQNLKDEADQARHTVQDQG